MKSPKLAALLIASTIVPATPALSETPAGSHAGAAERFNLDFPGGPIEELIAHLRQISDAFPNIIVPDAAAHVHVPAMTLRAVNIADLTAVLNEVGRTGTDNEQFGITRTTDTVWTVIAPKAKRPAENLEVLFLPISKHVEAHSIDDISTTIATAWEMLELPGEATSHIKYHQDTNLLIASGTPQMLEVINGALEALAADGKSATEKKLLAELNDTQLKLRAAQTDTKLAAQINQERSLAIQDDLRRSLEELREENAALRAKLRELESALAASGRGR